MTAAKPEASTFSRSTTGREDLKSKKDLIDGESHIIDKIFPLVHEIQKNIVIKEGFYLILMIFIVFQIISTAFWQEYSWQFHIDTPVGNAIGWIIKITLFTPLTFDVDGLLIRLILFAIMASTFVLMLVFQIRYYHINRRFIKWTLLISRIYFDFVPIICIVPCGNFIGECLYLSISSKNLISIIYLAVGLILYSVFIMGHYIMAYLFAETVYIPNSPNACWSGFLHFWFIFAPGVFAIVGWATKFFADWTHPVVIALNMVFNIYILYRLIWLPFSHLESNGIVATLHLILFVIDTLAFIQYFGIYIDYMYHVIFFFVTFILGMLVTKKMIESIVGRVKKYLMYEALEEFEMPQENRLHNNFQQQSQQMQIDDPRKRQLFMSRGLHASTLKTLLYMRIGLATGAPLFIDWSLIKFAAEFHSDAEISATYTQFVAYFPCESRLLSYFFNETIMKPKLGIGQRFIVYQVHRVKDIRQSSTSSDITEKLIELKNKTASLVAVSKNYWISVPKDISLMYEIEKNTAAINHLYEESISKWPNNVRLTEDYTYFLIEGASDYVTGLKMKRRSDLIEQGRSFIVDYCYRSLIRSYPFYLLKNIMDVHGNFINRGVPKKASMSSSSNGGSNSQMSFSMVGDLDAEVEDSLGKAAFAFPKLRLAYQRSLENRKSKHNQILKLTSFGAMITAVALNIFLFVWYFDKFHFRADNMHRQFVMNEVRFGYDANLVTISMYLNNMAVHFISDDLFGDCDYGFAMRSPRSNNHNLQWCNITHAFPPVFANVTSVNYTRKEINMLEEMQRWNTVSRDSMSDLLHQIQIIANTIDVYDDITAFVENIVPYDFCIKDMSNASAPFVIGINTPHNYNLHQILTYSLIKMTNLTQIRYGKPDDWAENTGVCEAFINLEALYDAFDSVSLNLSNAQVGNRNAMKREDYILLICFCVVFLCLWLPILIVSVYHVRTEIKDILFLLSNIDKKSRDDASSQIKLGFVPEDNGTLASTSKKSSISTAALYAIVVFFILFSVAIFVLTIMISDSKNTHFLVLNRWLFYGIKRGNYMLEIYFFTFLVIFSAQYGDMVPMVNRTLLTKMVGEMLGDLVTSNNRLLRGNPDDVDGDDLPPCINVDSRLDSIHFKEQCPPNVKADITNQTYSCMSLDAGISMFNVFITSMMADPKNVTIALNSSFFFAFNMVNNYMLDPAYEAADILAHLAADAIADFQMLLIIITIVAIVVYLAIYTLMHAYLKRIDLAYSGALHLMRRLPPLAINSNPSLLSYLLKKKDEETVTKMSPCQAAIMNSKDSVLFLNKSESIELVNKSVVGLFGYTPDQLLGQPLSIIIPSEENPKVHEQMTIMLNGEGPLIYESKATGITDDEQQAPVNITILGTSDHNSKSADSFVIIMRDVSEFLKQQEEAEAAKVQSETLLYQILPRDIVVRLNRGEVDISFVVPSSTVIFLDMVKFSDYASNLTPAQTMEHLSTVFASFDTLCKKYPLITKIKLIGDVYMAAAGLFTPDELPASHANEVVQFGLDCLLALEEVNSLLDSSLQVRIGVNTDGPLIAGVLGIDKPVFDIIGDPINVSARLQSTGIPGTVQISQKTYDLVSPNGYNIEPRGEIMLKGKGKQQCYIVRQKDVSSFILRRPSSEFE